MAAAKTSDAVLEVKEQVCGHVNRHWTGEEELTCVLVLGHSGNHKAPYKLGNGATEMGQWKDEAGTPVPVEE